MFRARTPMITSQHVCATRAVRVLSSNGSSGILTARLIERQLHLARTTDGMARRAMWALAGCSGAGMICARDLGGADGAGRESCSG